MLCLHMFTILIIFVKCFAMFCFSTLLTVRFTAIPPLRNRFEKGRSDLTKKTVKVPAIGLGKSPGTDTHMPSHAKTCAMIITQIKQAIISICRLSTIC